MADWTDGVTCRRKREGISNNSLSEEIVDDVTALGASEAVFAACVPVFEIVRRKSHQMQDRGVQISKVYFSFDCSRSRRVSFSVNISSFHSAASQPESEAASVVTRFVLTVFRRQPRASKFASPDDQRIVKQTPLFEITEQRCDRSVRHMTVCLQIAAMIFVLIPTAVANLDESNSGFGKSASQ